MQQQAVPPATAMPIGGATTVVQNPPPRDNSAAAKAAVCGGASICIICCLFFFGVPLFFGGLGLMINPGDEETKTTFISVGVVMFLISIALIVGGIVTVVYTVKFANKASRSGQQQGGMIITQQHAYPPAGQQQYVVPGQVQPGAYPPQPYPPTPGYQPPPQQPYQQQPYQQPPQFDEKPPAYAPGQ